MAKVKCKSKLFVEKYFCSNNFNLHFTLAIYINRLYILKNVNWPHYHFAFMLLKVDLDFGALSSQCTWATVNLQIFITVILSLYLLMRQIR